MIPRWPTWPQSERTCSRWCVCVCDILQGSSVQREHTDKLPWEAHSVTFEHQIYWESWKSHSSSACWCGRLQITWMQQRIINKPAVTQSPFIECTLNHNRHLSITLNKVTEQVVTMSQTWFLSQNPSKLTVSCSNNAFLHGKLHIRSHFYIHKVCILLCNSCSAVIIHSLWVHFNTDGRAARK